MRLFPQTKGQRLRLTILMGIALVIAVYRYGLPLAGYMLYTPQAGDIVFQSLQPKALVRMIEGATRSPYSHCGVVVKDGESWAVYQAYGSVTKPIAALPGDQILKIWTNGLRRDGVVG